MAYGWSGIRPMVMGVVPPSDRAGHAFVAVLVIRSCSRQLLARGLVHHGRSLDVQTEDSARRVKSAVVVDFAFSSASSPHVFSTRVP